MPLLPSLIKKVDAFVKIAERYSLVSLGADDMSLLAELADATKEVVNPEVSYNLKVLRAMYQKALEINGGFRTIYQAVQGMLEDLDPEEEESDSVSNLLNQISNQIEKRAGRVDSPGDMRELQMAASAVRAEEESPFSYDEPEEDESDMSAYEAGLLGYSEAKEEGGEKEELGKFLPGGSGAEAPGGKRGYGIGQAYTYKDWAQVYTNELEKYTRDLNGPVELLSPSARRVRDDVRVKSNLQSLVQVLDKLIKLTVRAVKLENDISLETELRPHPSQPELDDISKELRTLEAERRALKRNLTKVYKTSEIEQLQQKIDSPGTSPQEKRILEEKKKLEELRTSGKYGYGREAKERARLIRALTQDPNLKDEEFQKKQNAINSAAKFTDEMTKAQYDRKITEQKGKELAREVAPTYKAERGGGRVPMERLPKEQQINLEAASFDGLVYQFQIDIASATQAARQAIYEIKTAQKGNKGVKKQLNTEYKQIIDEISDAIRRKDRNALYAAKNKLITSVSKDASVYKYELKGYTDVIRLEPHFRKILDSIKDLTKNPSKKELKENPDAPLKMDADGNLIAENFSEGEKEIFKLILNDMYRLRDLYSKHYIRFAEMPKQEKNQLTTDWWKIKKEVSPRFKKVIDDMKKIEVRLALNLHAHRPEEKLRSIPQRSVELQKIWQHLEKTDPKRFEKLKQQWAAEEQSKPTQANCRVSLLKLAQAVGAEQEIDQATADRLANEFFDKVYDDVFQAMFNELQV